MRLMAGVGSRRSISFTTRTSRVGSNQTVGRLRVAANLIHHPGELDGVHALRSSGPPRFCGTAIPAVIRFRFTHGLDARATQPPHY